MPQLTGFRQQPRNFLLPWEPGSNTEPNLWGLSFLPIQESHGLWQHHCHHDLRFHVAALSVWCLWCFCLLEGYQSSQQPWVISPQDCYPNCICQTPFSHLSQRSWLWGCGLVLMCIMYGHSAHYSARKLQSSRSWPWLEGVGMQRGSFWEGWLVMCGWTLEGPGYFVPLSSQSALGTQLTKTSVKWPKNSSSAFPALYWPRFPVTARKSWEVGENRNSTWGLFRFRLSFSCCCVDVRPCALLHARVVVYRAGRAPAHLGSSGFHDLAWCNVPDYNRLVEFSKIMLLWETQSSSL